MHIYVYMSTLLQSVCIRCTQCIYVQRYVHVKFSFVTRFLSYNAHMSTYTQQPKWRLFEIDTE